MEIQKLEVHKKIWGSEEWIANNNEYCGKILNLKKGFRCSIHYHKKKHETFFILKGRVLMEYEGERKIMNSGDVLVVEREKKHRFTGLEDSEIIEFSTHHEDDDSYREVESGEVDLNKLDLGGLENE